MRWARWWRAPWWLVALATGAKSFADSPLLGSRRLNARGLHAVRVRLAHALTAQRRRRLAAAVPPHWREAFDRDGYVVVPDLLSPAELEAVRRTLSEERLPMRAHLQGDTITARVVLDRPAMARLPALERLLKRRDLRALFAYVAGTRAPPAHFLQTILGGAAPGDLPDPQVHLHADAFYSSMKAWLFLADVADNGRPLTYVAGSHRLTPARLAWERGRSLTVLEHGDRLSQRGSFRVEQEELPGLGLPTPTRFAVPANTLIVADMFGFHARGDAAKPTTRVELWSYSRRAPFLPNVGGWLLAPLAGSRGGLVYRLTDWLDRRGLRRQHWHDIGLQPAAAPDLGDGPPERLL
ncbi:MULTISPECIES: phytanoyl-CoA dioxygenase family protein [Sphingomonas]|uniref:phytanoyl-CoA dioxygenase family protein n=1 Tax=Sphingomonas TaxID=13687 RepID=UPI000DEF9DD6|nr:MULTISPECIES: phytanoyl-CoA dioxygenase family protein [Sphingomonas]